MRLILLVLMFGFAFCGYIPEDRPDEGADWSDVGLGPIELITKYKYPAEQHYTTTEDGYLLSIIRIPYGRLCPRSKNKGVIVLHHGIIVSCFCFILPGTKRGLAYILADMCYDVWMPNNRGTSLSLGHVNYTINDYEYWDFSWHEIGVYDTRQTTDYILKQTGVDKITYVSYSQAASTFTIFSSMYPEYNERIKSLFLLAPVTYVGNTKSSVAFIAAKFTGLIKAFLSAAKIYSLMRNKGFFNSMSSVFCPMLPPITSNICLYFLFTASGFDYKGINHTMAMIHVKHGFQGSSVKQFAHYGQLINSGKFQQYDYGAKNVEIYGQTSPPDYNLSKVTVPTYVYYSKNDKLANLKDVDRLVKDLPNVKKMYLVPHDKFGHFGHVWENDIINLEYDNFVKQIDETYRN